MHIRTISDEDRGQWYLVKIAPGTAWNELARVPYFDGIRVGLAQLREACQNY